MTVPVAAGEPGPLLHRWPDVTVPVGARSEDGAVVRSPGAERVVRFRLRRAVQVDHASPLVWSESACSRHNPPTR